MRCTTTPRPSLRATTSHGSLFSRRPRHITHRGRLFGVMTVAGVGNYLSEAFTQIFSVGEDEDVDWEKISMPFTGRITHHEGTQLRRLYDVVQAVKGCTDTSATNFNPDANIDDGSCVYDPNSEPMELQNYLAGALERVFGNQFKGDDTEPQWAMTPFSGEIKSQREIEKMVRGIKE